MPRFLRIAIALPGLHSVPRGAETALQEIARQLSRLGHRVTVFGAGQPRPAEPYRFQHVPCIPREKFERWPRVPFLRSHYAWEELTFAAALMTHYRPADFDVSLTCSYPYVSWVLRRGQPRHVYVTQNGDWMVHNRDAEFRFFDCDGLVCTNSQYFDRYSGHYPSALIPNGVDLDLFTPGAANRAQFGLPADKPVALMVSALIPSKRVVEGIRAAAKVPNLFLFVAGDGELRKEVDAEAARLLPGRFARQSLTLEQMPALYRCADVLLHMRQNEPFGIAYTEALAAGLPIVTHDWEATRWVLEDQAYLVDTSDEPAVVAALEKALAENSASKAASRRALAERRFSWTSVGRQYSDFLAELCGQSAPAPAEGELLADVGVVAIGRNEGQRLVRCLQSVRGRAAAVVYVDSASDDGSVENARGIGAEVVELDKNTPFTAALARNLGAKRLRELAPDVKFIQFVDGDCEVRRDWMAKARRELQSNPSLGAVCGRRRERFPRRTLYNRLVDIEWNTPPGPALAVGGDAMFRLAAFDSVGGYDPSVMAGEEPQLCLRLRHANWKILRIDAEMTLHDAAMTRFAQWWRRHVRAGYGTLDVNRRFEVDGERIFGKMVRSATVWAVGWPAAVIACALIGLIAGGKRGLCIGALAGAAILPLQILRISFKDFRAGMPPKTALANGAMTMLSKWAWFAGQMKYRRDRAKGRGLELIEYKRTSAEPARVIPV
jgi:glycosyltransferase involved in cell wall biosynthesis